MRQAVVISPQFDLCYALAEMLAPDPQIGADWWFPRGRKPSWLAAAGSLGWSFWLAVPDALGGRAPAGSVDEFIASLEALPADRFAERIRDGLFHSHPAKTRPVKREWLHFIGLDTDSRPDRLSLLDREKGAAIQSAAVKVLRSFQPSFEAAWSDLGDPLRRSAREASKLAKTLSLGELVTRLNLALEIDKKGRLRALRGGYAINLAEIDSLFLMPSAFNPRRFWTVADEVRPATAYFPFFVPGLLESARRASSGAVASPNIDPWFVCKALGDPTRAAILRRIARRPQPAMELMAALNLSKATISHHVLQLREAGLLHEERAGKKIILSINARPIELLESALKRELSLEGPP